MKLVRSNFLIQQLFSISRETEYAIFIRVRLKTKKVQTTILNELLTKAALTSFGKKHDFESIKDYSTFINNVPLQFYSELLPYINQIKQGESDILWPGRVNHFAVSAGTTGKGKHIPLSESRLSSDKAFMQKVAISYIKQRPNLFRLLGKHLSLPGSIEQKDFYEIGEISGFSARRSPIWLRPFQLLDPAKLVRLNFEQKFDLLLEKALKANLKVITAVPSWTLTLFQKAIDRTGKKDISKIWPNLNLLICGGVKLSNYKSHLQRLMGELNPDFIETYGASEGYFAFSDDLGKEDMTLVTDQGIFYEFIKEPNPEPKDLSKQKTISLWEVEKGVPYAIVVSTNAGLWRYVIKDIIEFTSTHPFRILVKGRISEMLDDFGEGIYIYEVEEVLSESLEEMSLQQVNFTIIPRLPTESDTPFHHWLIQFSDAVNEEILEKLEKKIDEKLQNINRHYGTRRQGGSFGSPKVKSIDQQKINRWLDSGNKTGAQRKLPKIIRENTEVFLKEE